MTTENQKLRHLLQEWLDLFANDHINFRAHVQRMAAKTTEALKSDPPAVPDVALYKDGRIVYQNTITSDLLSHLMAASKILRGDA